MDINKYKDEIVLFLFQNGIYDINDIDERKRIEDKVQRLKISDCSDYEFEKNLKLLQAIFIRLYFKITIN